MRPVGLILEPVHGLGFYLCYPLRKGVKERYE